MESLKNLASRFFFRRDNTDTLEQNKYQNYLTRNYVYAALTLDAAKVIDQRKVAKHLELPDFCCVEESSQTLLFNISAGGQLESIGRAPGKKKGKEDYKEKCKEECKEECKEGSREGASVDSVFQSQTAPRELMRASGSWFNLRDTLAILNREKDKLLAAEVYKNWMKGWGYDQSTLPDSFAHLLPLKLTRSEGRDCGLYCDEQTGGWFHIKLTSFHGRRIKGLNDVLMASLAAAAGQPVPKMGLFVDQPVGVSNYPDYWIVAAHVDNLKVGEKAVQSASREQLARLFVISAWLGNHQIFDHSYMGAGVDSTGSLYSLLWNAAGYYGKSYIRKRLDDSDWGRGGFSGTVFELKDFFNYKKHYYIANIFRKLQESDILPAMETLLAQPHDRIGELVDRYGPGGEEEKRHLKFILYERLNFLAILYPKNLPRLTGGELGAIAVSGLEGVELTVTSPYIVDHRVIVGYRLNASGEQETQISFRLNLEKQQKFSRSLMPGVKSLELQARLEYLLSFCSQADEKMTRVLKIGVEETRWLAEQMLKAYESREPCKEMSDAVISDCILALKECITGLQNLQDLPMGTKFPTGNRFRIPQLPEFLSKRFYVDQTITFPRYGVKGHQWQVIDDDTPGISYPGWRVCLLPKVPSSNFAMPKQPIEMEFHDSSAVTDNFEVTAREALAGYSGNPLQPDFRSESDSEPGGAANNGPLSFEGIVRLTSHGSGQKTIMGILDWMNGCGLETRRPDNHDWQQIYQQQLQKSLDKRSSSHSILSWFGLESSRNPLESSCERDWSDVIRRFGRTTFLHSPPVGGECQPESGPILHVNTLNYKEGEALTSSLSGGLSLWSDTERARLQGSPVTEQHAKEDCVAKLFPEDAQNENINFNYCYLELQPWVRDRIDFPMTTVLNDASPWRIRNEIPPDAVAISIPQTERSFGAEISFLDYLRHIHVADEATKNALLGLLKDEGLTKWPDGRSSDQLVTTSFPDLIRKEFTNNHLLSEAQKQLIDHLDMDNIRKLIKLNPRFLVTGELLKLDRIKIGSLGSDGTISDFDFSKVKINNAVLKNLTLKDCCFDKGFFENNYLQDVRIEFSGFDAQLKALARILTISEIDSSKCADDNLKIFHAFFLMLEQIKSHRIDFVSVGNFKAMFDILYPIVSLIPSCNQDVVQEITELLAEINHCYDTPKLTALRFECLSLTNKIDKDALMKQPTVSIQAIFLSLGYLKSDQIRNNLLLSLMESDELNRLFAKLSNYYSLSDYIDLGYPSTPVLKGYDPEIFTVFIKACTTASVNSGSKYQLLDVFYQFWAIKPELEVFNKLLFIHLFNIRNLEVVKMCINYPLNPPKNLFSIPILHVFKVRKENPEAFENMMCKMIKTSMTEKEYKQLYQQAQELFPEYNI